MPALMAGRGGVRRDLVSRAGRFVGAVPGSIHRRGPQCARWPQLCLPARTAFLTPRLAPLPAKRLFLIFSLHFLSLTLGGV